MSAWMVSTAHIDLVVCGAIEGPWRHDTRSPLVNTRARDGRLTWVVPDAGAEFGYRQREATIATADRVGRMLAAENARSLRARYADADSAEMIPAWADGGYTYSDPVYRPTVAELAHALDCYAYQACEADDFALSEACAFVEAYRRWLLRAAVTQLGLDKGPWGWEAADVAERRAVLGQMPVALT